jgi:hypothetical protein
VNRPGSGDTRHRNPRPVSSEPRRINKLGAGHPAPRADRGDVRYDASLNAGLDGRGLLVCRSTPCPRTTPGTAQSTPGEHVLEAPVRGAPETRLAPRLREATGRLPDPVTASDTIYLEQPEPSHQHRHSQRHHDDGAVHGLRNDLGRLPQASDTELALPAEWDNDRAPSAAAESETSAVVERVPAQFWGSTTTVAWRPTPINASAGME